MMRALPVLACVFLLAGCETLGYYRQGVAGQLAFYGARQPIADVLASPGLPEQERRRLELVPQVTAFARDQLALPLSGQYEDYVRLREPAVAWSVFAAPELSLEPYRWCYFFRVICVEYRGYFSSAEAQRYARRLRDRGYETHIGGVAAFSSLGLLDDPVTSVLTGYPDDLMASVLFHELAHAVVYVGDDTAFNESFASAVAAEGLRRWRVARGGTPESPDVEAQQREQQVLTATALALRARLQAIYASAASDDDKRARKREVLAGAAADYAARCAAMPGTRCTATAWFGPELNNARLNAVATYEHWVPAFTALIRAHDGDLAAFYRTVEALGEMPRAARDAVLRGLAPDNDEDTSP